MRKLPQAAAVVVVLLLAGTFVSAQNDDRDIAPPPPREVAENFSTTPIPPPVVVLPRVSPDLALQLVQKHGQWQNTELAAYSDDVEIDAQLLDTSQQGTFQLVRTYTAPNGLKFKAVKFTGDGFVKQNVINRLLQQEVEHAAHGDDPRTALTEQNYKFSYKGREVLEGREMHVFQVKPRRKEAGLFKGKIYVDSATGTLRRSEGSIAKSPSFFIKSIDFVQDYQDVAGFTLPVSMHSIAATRIVGRAVVNIFHRNYHPQSLAQIADPPNTSTPVIAAAGELN